MHRTNRIFAFAIAFFFISILSGCASLSIHVRDFLREEKPGANVAVSSSATTRAGIQDDKIHSARHETTPIALDNLTYARLAYAHWPKIVIVKTVLKAPKENAPQTNAPDATELNDAEKFIKPYLLKLWLDKRVMGMRSVSSGTGFVCGADADQQKIFICTNAHVVDDRDEVTVQTASGAEYRATVLAETAEPDAAVLVIKSKEKITPMVWGDSDEVSVGEAVMAIGHPHNFYYSASHGIVSGKRLMQKTAGTAPLRFLQLDMAINPGNSGSMLLNMRGEVVGVINMILGNAQGIAFAIPANDFQKIIEKAAQPTQNAPR